jgi:hypothetical protein
MFTFYVFDDTMSINSDELKSKKESGLEISFFVIRSVEKRTVFFPSAYHSKTKKPDPPGLA